MRRQLLGIVGALLLAVVLPACSQGKSAGGSGAPALDGGSSEGAKMLSFSAPALGGGTIEGADYVGKDVAIWFWAPW